MTGWLDLPSPATAAQRFRYLDGVRGLACLMVALCHFVTAFHWTLLSGDPSTSHFAGDAAVSHTPLIGLFSPDLGVAIFFVLSGFVLASSAVGRQARLLPLVARRWLRLGIPILATSLLSWIVVHSGLNFAQGAALHSRTFWLADQYSHITGSAAELARLAYQSCCTLLISQNLGGETARYYNSNLWTMPVEFIGSVGLFAVYLLIRPLFESPLSRIGVATAAMVLLWNSAFYGFPTGALLFECYARPWTRTRAAVAPFGLLFLACGLFLGATPYAIDAINGGVYAFVVQALNKVNASPVLTMHHAGAGMIIAGTILSAPVKALLQCRPVQALGRISFMLYLVQIPTLCSVAAGIVTMLSDRIGYNLATVIALGTYIGVAIGLARVLTHWVDGPAVLLARKVSANLASRLSPLKPAGQRA